MKKYLITSFGFLFLTLLFCSQNVLAKESNVAVDSISETILEEPAPSETYIINSNIAERVDNIVEGTLRIYTFITKSEPSISDTKPFIKTFVLKGQAFLIDNTDKVFDIEKIECIVGDKCLMSWDTTQVEDGLYKILITDSDNLYSSKPIEVKVKNTIEVIADTTIPVINVIEKTRTSSSGSYVRPFTNLKTIPTLEGQVLGAEKFIFTLLLKKGMKNNEVMELQKVLIANGLLKISTPTSYFGTLTQKAVKEFQIKNGLRGDGVIGELSRTVLNK